MSNDSSPNQGESAASKAAKRRAATRNPYLNFMREFRLKNKNMNVVEQTVKGAEMWRKMNESQKAPYVDLARQARRRRKKGKKRRRRGRRHSMESDY
ncbi:protamine-like [Coccinella septempunctata]|uniref:protamine-like n=1 Tax=Coccinella septempunctata TaxID=41139 RepID=UPI001D07E99E|nr:protamine-like [Coccinella septempunctata]